MALNNFQQRSISGFFFVIILIGSIWSGEWPFHILMSVIIGASVWELTKLNGDKSPIRLLAPLAGIVSFWAFRFDSFPIVAMGSTILLLSISLWNKSPDGGKNALFALGSIIYIVNAPLWMAETAGRGVEYDTFLPISYFILLWSNDTFAYLSGKWLGKTPLWPRHSPKKTLEGFIGGLIITGLAAGILSFFDDRMSFPQWALAAVIVGISATLGDLFESQLKRGAGIKDSSNLIPGHGGFLDRFDGFFFSAPLFCWYWQQIQII